MISAVTQKRNKAQMELLFFAPEGSVMPTVGDSVRLVPGGVFDLSGNPAHENNAWVRITGDLLFISIFYVVLCSSPIFRRRKGHPMDVLFYVFTQL